MQKRYMAFTGLITRGYDSLWLWCGPCGTNQTIYWEDRVVCTSQMIGC